jgi:hypothetical protein
MARIKYSPIVTEISGSVKNATFQRNASGHTLRQKPYRKKINSLSQSVITAKMQQLNLSWNALNTQQKAIWSQFLSYIPAYQKNWPMIKLSSRMLFIKYNMYRLQAGFDIMTAPGFDQLQVEPLNIQFHSDGNDLELELDDDLDPSTHWLLVKISGQVSVGNRSQKNLVRNIILDQAVQSTFTLTDNYIKLFGYIPQTGSYLLAETVLFSLLAPVFRAPVFNQYKTSSF